VVLVSVFRDGVEDLSRYKSDKETNKQRVMKVTETGELQETYSSEVAVGDFLYIPED
jgi:magnesium-transporting ATPase (P-type)